MDFSNFNRSVNHSIRTTLIAFGLIAASLATGSAHAALQGRDLNGSAGSFEAYYDTVLDITWLADANYAQTSGYDADGMMSWTDANTWVAQLSFTDGVNIYDNWRLPTTLNPDPSCSSTHGFNCTGSEMGSLFYSELGGIANQSILTSADPDLAKFTNLQAAIYWSTEYVANTSFAWIFYMNSGLQFDYPKAAPFYALAVSSGDIGNVAIVPEAQTYAMMLAGLGLVGVAAVRRKSVK